MQIVITVAVFAISASWLGGPPSSCHGEFVFVLFEVSMESP